MKHKLRGYLMDVLCNHTDKCSVKRDLQESLAYEFKGIKYVEITSFYLNTFLA